MRKLIFLGCAALAAALFAGFWWLFYWLWNTIAADILGAPELTFWQSVGLLFLVGFLVGLLTSGLRAVRD